MTDTLTDKKTESITALKNANKHLTDVFSHMNKMDATLSSVASDLQSVASKSGELHIYTWWEGKSQCVSLKTFLNSLAKKLEDVR